jgi:hypothetical protein
MGIGYSLICKKCGYSRNLFAGCGMMYHEVLREKTEEARKGQLGPRLAELFTLYPNGCLDVMNNVYYCPGCRAVECEASLDFYRPKDSGAPEEDVFGPDMDQYELVETCPHFCPKCGKQMKEVIRLTEEEPVDCPECGERLETGHMLMWD